MDIAELARECAVTVANGGLEAVGAGLLQATVALVKKARGNRLLTKGRALKQAEELLVQPDSLVSLVNALRDDPRLAPLATKWIEAATELVECQGTSGVRVTSNNNVSGVSGSNITITQSITTNTNQGLE